MGNRLSPVFAGIDARIAKPGNPDLDFHLTGLRVAEIAVLPAGRITEITLTFDTSEAAGFWIDSGTRECVFHQRAAPHAVRAGRMPTVRVGSVQY